MSFEDRETSRYQATPISLYLFRYGSLPSSWYAYTNHTQAITHTETFDEVEYDIEYLPIPIKDDGRKATGNMDKAELKISATRSIEMRELFVSYPPSSTVILTIRDGHVGDTEFLVSWIGKIRSFGREGDEVQMSGEGMHTALKRPGLRRHYQIMCPLVFLGTGPGACNKPRVDVLSTGTVVGVNDFDIVLSPGWHPAFAASLYPQGEVRWIGNDGETVIRQILKVPATDTLRVGGIPLDLIAGATVEITPGCAHRISDCDFYVNTPNYGGDNWIPTRTPFGFRNNFY